MYTGVGNQTVMQTMEMGPAEAALTQMSAIPSASSSSYFLQLDPSGHVDILESSLVLSKPDMADETVYEIQLDPYLMDERNVEIINLQNIPNTVTFQPEFLEEHQFTGSFDTTQVHYQVDGLNFNQILMNTAAEIPAPTTTTTETCSAESWEDAAAVPEYTVETEIGTEDEQVAVSSSLNSAMIIPGVPVQDQMLPQIQSLEYAQMVQGGMDATDKTVLETAYNMLSFTAGGSDALVSNSLVQETVVKVEVGNDEQLEQAQDADNSERKDVVDAIDIKAATDSGTTSQVTEKIIKEEPPDNIMDFTEEAVIPPVIEIFPTPKKTDEKIMSPPPIITVYDNENDEEDSSEEEPPSLVSKFLYDGIDPDDELYISYLRRPDATKTAMCILCYEWFHDVPELDEHVKSIHENNMKLYGCKRCGEQFWARFLRQRHEKLHRYDIKGPIQRYFPKNRPFDHYESRHYIKRFRPAPYTEKYRDHLKVIHSQIKSLEFDCIQCDDSFQSEEELREHYEENHALQTCIHCRSHFEGSVALRLHEQELHGLYNVNKNYPGGAWKLWNNWECDEMTEKDDRLVNLFVYHNYTKRIKNENSSGEETLSNNCDNFVEFGCEEVTVTELEGTIKPVEVKIKPVEKERRRSSASKQKANNQTAKLGETSKGRKTDPKPPPVKFQDYDKIEFIDDEQKPETLVKRNDLPFKCDTCKTSFDNDTDLQRHMKSHTIRTMAYMCQYCGRGFATHSNRKEHERIHTGDKPYVCPICSRAFVQISNLKKHIQTHKDKNNLQCSTCNKQFVKESSLILHQRAHSQDRKFRCHICDRAYNYASLLKRHMRIHTGENPYSCEDCGMQFHELVSLHYHSISKVHTGERPHRCEQCGRAFILSSDLKKHLKIHLRDGNSIKSSGASANAKSKSGISKVIVISESPNANTNGAIPDSVAAAPLMENNVPSPMDEDECTNNSSLMEFQADESVEMRDQTGTDRILVISETDLLNVTGNEAKVDGIINPDSANATTTNHENDFSHQNSTEAVP